MAQEAVEKKNAKVPHLVSKQDTCSCYCEGPKGVGQGGRQLHRVE